MSSLAIGDLITCFVKNDKEGTGTIAEKRLIVALQTLQLDLPEEKAKRILESSNAGRENVSYMLFLDWAFEILEKAKGSICSQFSICPYGVLGTQLTLKGKMAHNAAEPGSEIAIVDPAGVHYICNIGPSGAGGAAGVIYKWLGIHADPSFPEPVRAAITGPLLAKFYAYGDKRCIHVIGPDFRMRDYSRKEAILELALSYYGIFREFVISGLPVLRLLPVSGGIFSGPFGTVLPEITAEAMQAGFSLLSAEHQERLLKARGLEMCIFMESELAQFQGAFAAR